MSRPEPAQGWRQRRRETCIHEGGHVALMVACGWPVIRATTVGRDLDTEGRVIRAFVEAAPGRRPFIEVAAVDFAGGFAVALAGVSPAPFARAWYDLREIDRSAADTAEAMGVTVDDPRVQSVVRRAAELALAVLSAKWVCVAALAGALERDGEIDAATIEAVVGATWHLPGAPPVPLSELSFEPEVRL